MEILTSCFETTSTAVDSCLKQTGYAARTLAEHRRCCDALRQYFMEREEAFSMEEAIAWLAERKSGWSYDTYKRYRRAVYRLDGYMKNGSIEPEAHCHNNYFAYYDADVSYIKLPDKYKTTFREFYAEVTSELSRGTVDHYIACCTEFLLFIAKSGCTSPNEITIDHVLAYADQIRGNQWTDETKSKYVSGVSKLLAYFHVQGYIPRCYGNILSDPIQEALKPVTQMGQAFHPSDKLEMLADDFLSQLEKRRYSEPTQKLFGFIFNRFFLFLEKSHLEYSPDAIDLWLNLIPMNGSWKLQRQIIEWFADYLRTGSTDRQGNTVWRKLLIDTLPDWSRAVITDYLEWRQREGWAKSTLLMIRSSCVRFFWFLAQKGVENTDSITPALVAEFHNTDPHATAKGRNAYSSRVRKLLRYMAEQNLVPQNLYLAISTQYAEAYKIVSILTQEMESAIYNFRERAREPLALRNAAIVLIGLRMGLRASDVVNLRINDIDWERQTVSFIQTKTLKAITQHMSTEVGNTLTVIERVNKL